MHEQIAQCLATRSAQPPGGDGHRSPEAKPNGHDECTLLHTEDGDGDQGDREREHERPPPQAPHPRTHEPLHQTIERTSHLKARFAHAMLHVGAARVVPLVRRLLLANLALAILLAIHIADHSLRQPDDGQLGLTASLPGLLGALAVFVSLALVVSGYRYAPQVAGTIGILTAVGFVAVHLAPHWSMFSDPYADRELDAGSWIQMLVALAGGLLLAFEAGRVATWRA